MIQVYAPLAVAVIGVFLIGTGLLRRPRLPYLQGCGAALALVGLLFALLGLNMRAYIPRADDHTVHPMAAIAIRTLYPVADTFSVTVQHLDGPRRRTTCILKGNDWALEGHVQQWHWWAFVLGMQQSYVADRIVGTRNTPEGIHQVSSCSLLPARPKIMTYLPGSLIRSLIRMSIDSEQAINQTPPRPLTDGGLFRVDITPQGFAATTQMLPSQLAAAETTAH